MAAAGLRAAATVAEVGVTVPPNRCRRRMLSLHLNLNQILMIIWKRPREKNELKHLAQIIVEFKVVAQLSGACTTVPDSDAFASTIKKVCAKIRVPKANVPLA